jgi:hypothetical protein
MLIKREKVPVAVTKYELSIEQWILIAMEQMWKMLDGRPKRRKMTTKRRDTC